MQEKTEERPQDLSGFREALTAQYRERQRTLKRAMDDELADVIAARRLEVEGIVHRLRRSSEDLLREGQAADRRYLESRVRSCRAAMQNSFLVHLEKAILARVDALRLSGEYEDVMNLLASEARERMGGPSVALVEKGDAVFLKALGDIREVREELEGVWGGLMLIGTEEQGKRVVDNTFRTRWSRLCPGFLSDRRESLKAVLEMPFAEMSV